MIKKQPQAAILIVNGGIDPYDGHWLSLCVGKIVEHTPGDAYRLYVWNNSTDDAFVADYLRFIPNCTLVQAEPGEKLGHVHAEPLQRLYELARTDSMEYFVTLDTDAHPTASGWLQTLIDALEAGAALSGVYRDELQSAIEPYIHASCLATTREFIEDYGLRFDYIAPHEAGRVHDTLSSFTDTARAHDLHVHPLRRSNHRNFHRLMGGIYGNAVYHHGAGSRPKVSFWDEEATAASKARNRRINEIATHFLYNDYKGYMAYLRGEDVDSGLAARLDTLAAGRLETFHDIPTTDIEVLTRPVGPTGKFGRAREAAGRLYRRLLRVASQAPRATRR